MVIANLHVLLEMSDEPDCCFVAAWHQGGGSPDTVDAGAER